MTRAFVDRGTDRSGLQSRQHANALRTRRIITGLVGFSALLFVWGIGIEGILLLSTSIVTLTGVALFAQWSMLSNITAYFVLLTHPGIVRGAFLRLIEGDNYLEGTLADIGPFHTRLITEERVAVLVPNTAVLMRVVVVNPRDRMQQPAGKLTPPAPAVAAAPTAAAEPVNAGAGPTSPSV